MRLVIEIISNAGALVVVVVLGVFIHSTPVALCAQNRSNSVLTFPNNIFRHTCQSLRDVSSSVNSKKNQCKQCKQVNVGSNVNSLNSVQAV